jgi:ubiquitin-protein ligase
MAVKRLHSEHLQILNEQPEYYSVQMDENNFLKWNVIIFGPEDTIFEGGIFKCILTFSFEYPNKSPKFKFIDNIFHPNIYKDGNVCISILHEGHDEFGYEHISERWTPSQSVNSILISVISILSEPNFESPANVDASKMWREDFNQYKKIIYNLIAKNQ